MGVHYLLSDGKTQAGPGSPCGALIIGLVELVEDSGELILGNAGASVLHGDPHARIRRLEAQRYGASPRRELERVRQQVAEHLVDAVEVPKDLVGNVGSGPDRELDCALSRQYVECALHLVRQM